MAISESTQARWSHHQAATTLTQAHLPIRAALDAYSWPSDMNYEVFLQGSYKNDTNLGQESDVDVVVRLNHRLRPRVAKLSGQQLQEDPSHHGAYQKWKSFRDHALKALRVSFGNAAKSDRKTLKVPKGKIPADADLVVTLRYREGIAFYLPDERRWVVSFPQQHHARGVRKERAASNRFKRTIRMFKAARNRLVETKALTKDDAPSYFIECLLYNVPEYLFAPKLAPTYTGIVGWLRTVKLNDFKCQSGQAELLGSGREQWSEKKARVFVKALQSLWDAGGVQRR
ncbi:MAG: nucleotidyltransferase [Caldilineaceae bacterium SB0664_bin_27]|uniref:Nucleotidyltransferase n=1 Tax=Caldilineaceae bacterium SB0664_bin_27 TaxID=2605260 RepID=A0A6B0YPM7_9CHLR|nr:nucleotidyltransferase [Caldilineaceae bacterium SB0664_bin_27]